ncbi:MAG: MBL fold metallo-hydrolase [Candidatus Lokiarchaeota archaeon]|nr:MBL fold metallo-hydrolase [Candidatus Lokiarchaeota archaeon]
MSYIIDQVLYSIPSYGFNSNIYIFLKKVLIDTGHDNSFAQKVIDHLKSYNINLEKIIITHIHPDHSGNAYIFQEAFNADLYVHESIAKKFQKLGDKIHSLKDGTIIEVDDKNELQVIYTPGHTPSDISIYNEKYKILFSGDCVFAQGSIGRTDLPGSSHQKLIESIEKLIKLDVEYLCPGHMAAVTNAKAHINQSLNFAKRVFY